MLYSHGQDSTLQLWQRMTLPKILHNCMATQTRSIL